MRQLFLLLVALPSAAQVAPWIDLTGDAAR
jgi:hypothetical protein